MVYILCTVICIIFHLFVYYFSISLFFRLDLIFCPNIHVFCATITTWWRIFVALKPITVGMKNNTTTALHNSLTNAWAQLKFRTGLRYEAQTEAVDHK